jgi:hypothetical protein
VLFIVCLSVAANIATGISAYTADQQHPAAPTNICNYMMDYDCHVFGCDKCDHSSADCKACIDDCKRWTFPDCYGSI